MKTTSSHHHPDARSNPSLEDEDWVGAYGFGGHHGPGYDASPDDPRDVWERAADAFLSLIGDEDAQRRLRDDRARALASSGPEQRH